MIIPLTPTSLAVAVALDREAFARPEGSEFTLRELMASIMDSSDAIQKVDVASIQETAALLRAVSVYSQPLKDAVTYVSILASGGLVATKSEAVPLAALRFSVDPQMIIGKMAVRLGAELAKSWPSLLDRINAIHNHQQGNPADTRKEDS